MRSSRVTLNPLQLTPLAAVLALTLGATTASATNGMNMEGYGPISAGMGGASQAVDHGTAAMAQNPATLALMSSTARFDGAIGLLGPKVASSMNGMPTAESGGTSYAMPGMGYVRRSGSLVYGVGLFAQGGMGTEYDASSFLAAGSGQPVRSELSVGRVLIPLVWQVSPRLSVGGSLDFVWAGLDLRMAMSGAQMGGLVTGASGNLAAALPALGGAPWARVDFSNDSDMSGQARANGWAGKIGFVFKPEAGLTLGGSYQMKTQLGDLKTSGGGAALSATGGFTDSGRITVIDFQWPATTALGMAWQATPAWLVAADIKRIGWASVMKNFRMRYDSAGMGGSVSFALPQNWADQTVWSLGASWSVNDAVTLRAGYNRADNPIPDAYVNPLFPATVQTHYTLGAGWRFAGAHGLDASLTLAPEAKIANAQGVVITHKQSNVQVMYSYRF